jgi:hypothetical protein
MPRFERRIGVTTSGVKPGTTGFRPAALRYDAAADLFAGISAGAPAASSRAFS